MDFFNRTVDQVKDLFATMTPGARITAGLLLAVVVISLGYLIRTSVDSSNEYLLGGRSFSTAELNAMEAAFSSAGLSDYTVEGSQIRVPGSNKSAYLAALADGQALPANFSDHFKAQANNSSIFESKDRVQRRWRLAKQQELSLIISQMNGISKAQVIYDEVDKPGFPRKTEKTATVAVQAEGTRQLEAHQVRAMKYLVASAVAGLSHRSISVTDLNSGRVYGSSSETNGGLGGMDENDYISRKQTFEDQWKSKIREALSFVPGAVVSVDVELSAETMLQRDEITVKEKPVSIQSTAETRTTSSTRPGPRGRPGTVGQGANQQVSIDSQPFESTTEESSESQRALPGHGRTITALAPMVPKRVSASIGVPSSYYLDVWKQRNPPVEGEEPKLPDDTTIKSIEAEVKTNIEEMVVNLLPKVEDTLDKYPLVMVRTFQHSQVDTIPEPGMATVATGWLADNWSTAGLLLLGVFSLVMLRGMLKASPDDPHLAGAENSPGLSVVGTEDDDEEDEENQASSPGFAKTGVNMKEQLAGMIRENPEAAANILKSWIGEAS